MACCLTSRQYWASMAFICLAVPESHPFWTATEESTSGTFPNIKALTQPGHIMRFVTCTTAGAAANCG